ncbi:MAG: FixH family protein [Flavobacteriales bacterium]
MNWGWGISIFYGSFVVFMLGMVTLAFQQDFDLVADDYYEQEIAYQGRIDQMNNAAEDRQKVAVTSNGESVQLAFGATATDVSVHFFRPSDDTMDFLLEEENVELALNVPISRFRKGKYLVKIEWKLNGKTYYQEEGLFLD